MFCIFGELSNLKMLDRFNLIGQIAITAGADFGLANLISTTAQVTRGYDPSAGKTLAMVALILISHVVVNAFGIRHLRYAIYIAMFLNSISIAALGLAVLAGAKTHKPAAFVFANFHDGTAANSNAVGWSVRASPAYVAICGTLFSQYTLLGFDASAHLCEETRKAVAVAPWCLLSAVGASFVCGFLLLLSLLFSIQDFAKVRTSPIPVLQIFTDSCGESGGLVLITIVMLCVWHCGLFSMVRTSLPVAATAMPCLAEIISLTALQTSNSRMMFSFARDGGIPHKLHIVNDRSMTPLRAVIFAAVCAFLLCLPSLGSTTAFFGTTSIATVGLFISYGIPIALASIRPNFRRGPFNLGKAGRPIGAVSCIWIAFITIAFCLPTVNPVTSQTLNYTGVAVGIVGIGAFGSWGLWARKWFTGRCRNHCRICIRQLDLLAENTVDEPGSSKSVGDTYLLQRRESRRPLRGRDK